MVVDSSALAAILFGEPEAMRLTRAIHDAGECLVPAPVLVELAMVITARLGAHAAVAFDGLDALLRALGARVVPFDADAAAHARDGARRHGRHVGARAALNFGDCLVYGVARATGLPLLFKGDDFAQTDLPAVPY